MPAGIRSAASSLRLATANGPDPIGWRLNDRSASWSTGIPARMWAGAIGWVAAWRKPPSGVLSVNTTVWSPSVATADLVPRSGARTPVVGVLEDTDGERDVLGGDRLAIVPARVVTELERPDRPRRIDRPALGEIGHERPGRPVPDEPGVDQRDEVAVGLGAGTQRADRDGPAEDALAIRARDRGIGRAGLQAGGGGRKQRRDTDEARDQREQRDEGPDDE